ncbi:hypothetical protein ASG31_01590 [Chryseobacterium sp. Leaf404]|uniref:hypothetical protein n=1 Tax=unclassified Chryseobacterium TaxID=2593645 RepID=UPI0006F47D17|nr:MULTISPECIES: hypothetical protein [unclassified Chryseobacterium]KQT22060.1 hypothetical protein ASG31_01590 [Chryseobacterium sp. Leaf404]
MKNIFLALLSAIFLAVSCKKDEKPTYIKDENGVQQPTAGLNNTPKASLMSQAGIAANPAAPQGVQQVSAPPGMLNPAHGQPGHRCDIAVGQPLDAAPAQNAPASAQNINVNAGQTVNVNPAAVSPGKIAVDGNGKVAQTAPGMNPPHGQPGHRCDIPVGQPLNSKPAPAAAQNNVQVQAPQPAPAAQQIVANTGPKPKNNPAHGEPWHDCAKQVGAPL